MDDDRTYLNTIIRIHDGFGESANEVHKLKNETSFETRMKQVLKQKDYDKLYPIIDFLEKNRQITIQQAMTVLHKSRKTSWRYMKILVDVRAVEADGSTNNLIYKIV